MINPQYSKFTPNNSYKIVVSKVKRLYKPNRSSTFKRTIKQVLTFICVAVSITSCNKITPAGFWADFHKDLILTKNSDQGPWGGHREIAWKGEAKNTFTDKALIEFASKNNWELIDSVSFSVDTLTKNSFSKLKAYDYSLDILNESILPKLKTNDNRVFVFKTSWLEVESGNARETFENGFAILNSDGTELKIFHLWGD